MVFLSDLLFLFQVQIAFLFHLISHSPREEHPNEKHYTNEPIKMRVQSTPINSTVLWHNQHQKYINSYNQATSTKERSFRTVSLIPALYAPLSIALPFRLQITYRKRPAGDSPPVPHAQSNAPNEAHTHTHTKEWCVGGTIKHRRSSKDARLIHWIDLKFLETISERKGERANGKKAKRQINKYQPTRTKWLPSQ